jgi:hypothetical protein
MCFTINRLGETRADPANVGYSGDNEPQRDCPNQRRRSFNRGHGSCVAVYPEHLSLLFAEGIDVRKVRPRRLSRAEGYEKCRWLFSGR